MSGIAWLDRQHKPLGLDFEQYTKSLSDICIQIGSKPAHLKLNPVIRVPGEDDSVMNAKMKAHMTKAKARMGKLLTSMHRKRSRSDGDHNAVLIVLDDLANEEDIEWFQFLRDGKGEQVNDLLVTSRTEVKEAVTVNVTPLETREAIKLFTNESGLSSNHPISKNHVTRSIAKKCFGHPLTIKFAGR